MHILIIDNHSLHKEQLATLLADHEVVFSDYTDTYPLAGEYDLVILSGSHEHPFYSDWFTGEIDFIHNTAIPVLGICLGAQLLAHAYGSSFYTEEKKLEWVQHIKYIPTQSHYEVYEGHKFCINELSDELVGVAASEYGYEIIRHTHKKQWWIQFHPEVTEPKNDGALLFAVILSELIS